MGLTLHEVARAGAMCAFLPEAEGPTHSGTLGTDCGILDVLKWCCSD